MENIFFKHLPNHIPKPFLNDALADIVWSTPDDVAGKFMVPHDVLLKRINPEFFDWIENKIGLLISDVEIFHSPPHYVMPIHTDGPNIHSEAKLNFMYGAPHSQMKWWLPKEGVTPKRTRMNHTNAAAKVSELSWNIDDCIELASTEVVTTLVQVGMPHNIVNGSLPRKCVSVIFDKPSLDFPDGRDPMVTFEEAVERFSNEDAYYF